ncbi:MAG: hypothetical protein HC945_01445 [Nitrosarchaeum sp.]|nr:hypothetical protein [Nitrosarchaeum sp.]
MTRYEDYEDLEIEEIRGASKKKSDIDMLNTKKKISSYELDELFLDPEE